MIYPNPSCTEIHHFSILQQLIQAHSHSSHITHSHSRKAYLPKLSTTTQNNTKHSKSLMSYFLCTLMRGINQFVLLKSVFFLAMRKVKLKLNYVNFGYINL